MSLLTQNTSNLWIQEVALENAMILRRVFSGLRKSSLFILVANLNDDDDDDSDSRLS
jgi:hypothetical protein